MVFNLVLFAGGVLLISCGVSYILWVKVRETLLKQDLFEIRDSLWDTARNLNGLNDSAYRECRSHLNGCIDSAYFISLPVILLTLRSKGLRKTPTEVGAKAKSEDPELQEAIDVAYKATHERLFFHLVWERPCSTIPAMLWIGTMLMLREVLEKWVRSRGPIQLANYERIRHSARQATAT